MGAHKDTKPQWVLYKDQLYHVSEFALYPVADRPHPFCTLCRQEVVLKLGKVRAHHYAHRPDENGGPSLCAATQPETALHLNLKFHLLDQLQSARELWVEQACKAGCQNTRRVVLVCDWDEVSVECPLDRFRLDVALLRQEQVIGALEVVVTHATDAAKVEYLDRHQIRWLELAADESLYEGPEAWTPQQPLPVDLAHLAERPWWQSWICPTCRDERERQQQEQQKRMAKGEVARQKIAAAKTRFTEPRPIKVAPAPTSHFRSEVKASRLIEVTFRSGKFLREIFYIIQEFDAEGPSRVVLQSGFQSRTTLAQLPGGITLNKLRELEQIVENWCAQQRKRGAEVDDSMAW